MSSTARRSSSGRVGLGARAGGPLQAVSAQAKASQAFIGLKR